LATIAVVGTGLDRVYPRQHRELAHRIAQQGVILSECALGTPPLAHHFPKRNRIIAGLSHGVLVVEAALQSGSLITARLAAEQGKEVFAIPGSIHAPQSRGCHALIRQGAKLVESAQDVAEELQHVVPGMESPATGGGAVSKETAVSADCSIHGKETVFLLQALGHDPVGLDALLERTGLDAATLQARLLELELVGVVGRLPGGLFQRIGRA
jgi:DNA processing protein